MNFPDKHVATKECSLGAPEPARRCPPAGPAHLIPDTSRGIRPPRPAPARPSPGVPAARPHSGPRPLRGPLRPPGLPAPQARPRRARLRCWGPPPAPGGIRATRAAPGPQTQTAPGPRPQKATERPGARQAPILLTGDGSCQSPGHRRPGPMSCLLLPPPAPRRWRRPGRLLLPHPLHQALGPSLTVEAGRLRQRLATFLAVVVVVVQGRRRLD